MNRNNSLFDSVDPQAQVTKELSVAGFGNIFHQQQEHRDHANRVTGAGATRPRARSDRRSFIDGISRIGATNAPPCVLRVRGSPFPVEVFRKVEVFMAPPRHIDCVIEQ